MAFSLNIESSRECLLSFFSMSHTHNTGSVRSRLGFFQCSENLKTSEKTQVKSLSVRTSQWKFVEPSDGPEEYRWAPDSELGYRPYPQLFDLDEDPREQRNVADSHPDTVRELEAILASERTNGPSSDH
jgi:hypothetical protein